MIVFKTINGSLYKRFDKNYKIIGDEIWVKCSKSVRIGTHTYSSETIMKDMGDSPKKIYDVDEFIPPHLL